MSRALVLQNSESFGPGRIVPILRDFGVPIDLRQTFRGDAIPANLDEVRVLVVLGSPTISALGTGVGAGAGTGAGDANLAFLKNEIDLLSRAIAQDRATLAIGLGAQLLAQAGGAKVYPNVKPGATPDAPGTPMPEYGWTGVNFPFPGGTEPIVFGMTDGAPMFQWHADTFDLPKLPAPPNPAPPPAPPPPTGNALLASTRACKNQAFRFKSHLFGFQYHFELTQEDFEKFFATDRDVITRALGADGEKRLRDETTKNYPRYARLGDRLLNNFVQYLHAY